MKTTFEVLPAQLQQLPIRVRRFHGESSDSYFRRLVIANHLGPQTVRRYLYASGLIAGPGSTGEDFVVAVSALSGISVSLLDSRTDNGSYTLRPICRCCAHGNSIMALNNSGFVCMRHQRWCDDRSDLNISSLPELVQAERRFRKIIAPKGVSRTDEAILLCFEVIGNWVFRTDDGRPELIADRANRLGIQHGSPRIDARSWAWMMQYPEAITLAELVTSAPFISSVLDPGIVQRQAMEIVTEAVSKLFEGRQPWIENQLAGVVKSARKSALLLVEAVPQEELLASFRQDSPYPRVGHCLLRFIDTNRWVQRVQVA